MDVTREKNTCKLEIKRSDIQASHMGEKLSPDAMEIVFHMAFTSIDSKETIVMGEMALLENEINPVIDELRKGNIDISAIHNHMIFEEPRIFYLHFQGMGDLTKQAETIKNSISKTGHK